MHAFPQVISLFVRVTNQSQGCSINVLSVLRMSTLWSEASNSLLQNFILVSDLSKSEGCLTCLHVVFTVQQADSHSASPHLEFIVRS